ncbi:MAG: DUF3793 family protein [Clostridiales bacterium]|nr:DUF3793 family protein [Clostridiales bacterium]
MSEEQLIRHCAPTLACLKTGNLVACTYASQDEMLKSIRRYNRRFTAKGLRFVPLRSDGGKALIYVYRPALLEKDLSKAAAGALLHSCGYRCKSANHCVRCLRERCSKSGEDFPHEIGLFLSYPPTDVYGFIHHRNKARYSGAWKVYGNVAQARKTFARYKKCTDTYMRLWQGGRSAERLTVKGGR